MIRSYGDPECAIARSLEILGDGWTILVLREAFLGTRRFADFEARLAISKNVLTTRLAHLVEAKVLEKRNVGRFGERYEYRLTAMGKDLVTVMTALRQWGDRWVFGDGKEPILVVDRQTDESILPVRIRRVDGSIIEPKDLEIKPGPGVSAEALERWQSRASTEAPRRSRVQSTVSDQTEVSPDSKPSVKSLAE